MKILKSIILFVVYTCSLFFSSYTYEVSLTFLQLPFINYGGYYDENNNYQGYMLCGNEVLATTTIYLPRCHYISDDELRSFRSNSILNYIMTSESCYYFITAFYLDYDVSTGHVTNALEPGNIYYNTVVYFGIY